MSLRPDRLAVLRLIAEGKRPEVQRDPTVPYTLRPQLGGYRSDQVRRAGRP